MSTAVIARPRKSFGELPWQLWATQLAAVLRIEIKKTLWMRRSIWIYLLAFFPTVILASTRLPAPWDVIAAFRKIRASGLRVPDILFTRRDLFWLHGPVHMALPRRDRGKKPALLFSLAHSA